nr:SKI8 subunit of superkiller complex protein-like [Cherax quadricarinatus]
MFSLLTKRENAHSEGIWACAWGHFVPDEKNKEAANVDKENEGEDKENQERRDDNDQNLPETEQRYIVTGGLDDLVRVWRWSGDGVEGELTPLHTLEGHSLGVISVDVNAAGTIAASSSLDSTIRLWDLHTGEQVRVTLRV